MKSRCRICLGEVVSVFCLNANTNGLWSVNMVNSRPSNICRKCLIPSLLAWHKSDVYCNRSLTYEFKIVEPFINIYISFCWAQKNHIYGLLKSNKFVFYSYIHIQMIYSHGICIYKVENQKKNKFFLYWHHAPSNSKMSPACIFQSITHNIGKHVRLCGYNNIVLLIRFEETQNIRCNIRIWHTIMYYIYVGICKWMYAAQCCILFIQ